MNYELLFPSLYLKAAELQGKDVTVTIEKVQLEELTMRGGLKKKKGVIYLRGKEKMIVLNRTNAETIVKLYGPDTNGWIGKRITIYADRVTFGRETVDAIRVRPKVPADKNAGNGQRQKPPQAPPPTQEQAPAPADDIDETEPPDDWQPQTGAAE